MEILNKYSDHVAILMMIFITYFTFRRTILHYQLLKLLYPEKMVENKTYIRFILNMGILNFNIRTILWWSFPIYFSLKKSKITNEVIANLNNRILKTQYLILLGLIIFTIYFGILDLYD